MQDIEDLPDIIQDVYQEIEKVLKQFSNLSKVEIKKNAVNTTLIINEKWGGMNIYIPKGSANKVIKRNKQIRLDFNGTNHQELCFKYKLSLVVIYKILRKDQHEKQS